MRVIAYHQKVTFGKKEAYLIRFGLILTDLSRKSRESRVALDILDILDDVDNLFMQNKADNVLWAYNFVDNFILFLY